VKRHHIPEMGGEARRQYMTELEAAHGREDGKRRWALPRNTVLDQSERVRVLVARVIGALERATRKQNRLGHVWTPSLEEVRAVQAAVSAHNLALVAEEKVRDLIAAERAGYNDEQWEAAWKASMLRSVQTWEAGDWWIALRQVFGDDAARVLVRLQFGEDVLAGLEGS
jgi:hypothetical protein